MEIASLDTAVVVIGLGDVEDDLAESRMAHDSLVVIVVAGVDRAQVLRVPPAQGLPVMLERSELLRCIGDDEDPSLVPGLGRRERLRDHETANQGSRDTDDPSHHGTSMVMALQAPSCRRTVTELSAAPGHGRPSILRGRGSLIDGQRRSQVKVSRAI